MNILQSIIGVLFIAQYGLCGSEEANDTTEKDKRKMEADLSKLFMHGKALERYMGEDIALSEEMIKMLLKQLTNFLSISTTSNFATDVLLGTSDSSKAILTEFSNLRSDLSSFHAKMDHLKQSTNAIPANIGYEELVKDRLYEMENHFHHISDPDLSATIKQEAFKHFLFACKDEGVGPSGKALKVIGKIRSLIEQEPDLMTDSSTNSIFRKAAHNEKRLTGTFKLILNHLIESSIFGKLCLVLDSQTLSTEYFKKQVHEAVEDLLGKWKVLSNKVRQEFHIKQLNHDLRELLKQHRHLENKQLVSHAYKFLLDKYPFLYFSVTIFNFLQDPKAEQGINIEPNSPIRGMVWDSYGKKGGVIYYIERNSVGKGWAESAHEKFSHKYYKAFEETSTNCHYEASKALESMKEWTKNQSIKFSSLYVIILPEGETVQNGWKEKPSRDVATLATYSKNEERLVDAANDALCYERKGSNDLATFVLSPLKDESDDKLIYTLVKNKNDDFRPKPLNYFVLGF